jgi:putative transcription factor
MPSCEMCGKEFPTLRRALIEGTTMSVCGNCVKFGVEQAGPKVEVTGRSATTQAMERRAVRAKPRDIYDQMQEELVEDYGERVKQARTRAGLSVEDLGKAINERASNLANIEKGTYHPPDALVRKLEKALDVKLKEKPEPSAGIGGRPVGNAGAKELTLGDLIKKQLEKK